MAEDHVTLHRNSLMVVNVAVSKMGEKKNQAFFTPRFPKESIADLVAKIGFLLSFLLRTGKRQWIRLSIESNVPTASHCNPTSWGDAL